MIYLLTQTSPMHKTGHIGTALLVYSPIGLALLLAGFDELAVLGGAGMIALATLPDCDHRLPLVSHRGPTHSIPFALAVGAMLGAAGVAFGEALAGVSAATMGAFAFGIGALAILSHLAADSITPMGIRPLWPLSSRRYTLAVTGAANPLANYVLLGVGVGAVLAAVGIVAALG